METGLHRPVFCWEEELTETAVNFIPYALPHAQRPLNFLNAQSITHAQVNSPAHQTAY